MTKHMMIEIHGAGFANKGAQLMLWTVIQKLRSVDPSIELCIEPGLDRPYADRAAYGLQSLFPPAFGERPRAHPTLFRFSRVAGRLIPGWPCRMYGVVRRQDTDALLDISGYAFGDKWGWRLMRNFTMRAAHYKRRGKPVILLPQMFGPFEEPLNQELFRRLKERADLVYARDKISLEWAQRVGGRVDHIRLAPDITIFTSASSTGDAPIHDRSYVCLIPNTRLLDIGRAGWDNYIPLMQAAGRRIIGRGLRVSLVAHDSAGADAKLARQIMAGLDANACELCVEADPLRLKRYLAGARFLVGSRFHSIVGALSSGVPAITLGWAHKYDALLEDFDVADLLYRPSDPAGRLEELIDGLLDDAEWRQRHDALVQAKRGMEPANASMWSTVLGALGISSPREGSDAAQPERDRSEAQLHAV